MGGSLFIFLLFHNAVNLFFFIYYYLIDRMKEKKENEDQHSRDQALICWQVFLLFSYANRCLITFIGLKTSLDLTDSQAIISFFCAWR